MLEMYYLCALLYFSLSWLCCDFFPLEDYNLTAKIGGHVVFNCPLDFPMDIVVPYILEWRKDNQLIFSWYDEKPHAVDTYSGRIQLLQTGEWGLGKGSINLTSIRETDNGYYHCLVIFPNRSPPLRNNGTYFFLEVEGANLLVTPPMNVTCLEGTRAELECVPKSLDLFVKWYKDGDPISDLMDLAYRSTLESNGSLVIDPTMMNDLGEYECHVANEANDVQIASAYLNVEYKAKVVYAPPERYLAYGKPASLDCHYAANPPLTNLRWEKDGFLFDPYNVPGVFYSRNGSLLFNKIDESHEGYYSCTPYNRLGTEGPSPKIRVVVQKPAIFLVRPQPIYLTRIGGKVEMNCVASDGYVERPPYINWRRKDGVPLPEHRTSIQNGNITIVDINEEDRGVFVCSASNEADTITAETEIMIDHVAPRAPYNLTATVGKTFIRVHWVEGYKRQHKDVYVWYRTTDGTEWRTLKIVEPDITEATIHNLKPGQEYEIRILSQDYVGDGLFSKPLIAMTLDEDMNELLDVSMRSSLSTGPPINVTARSIEDKILLTWSPPAFGANDVHKYIVRWYAGIEENLLGSSETHNLYFLVPGLEEDTRYTFVVFAVTSQDAQFSSDRVVLTVPAYARIKAIGTIVGCVALLVAILAFVVYVMRKNVCQKNKGKC